MEAVLFFASIALCVVCGISFIKRDDKEHQRFESIDSGMSEMKDGFKKESEMLQATTKATETLLSDFDQRLLKLEHPETPAIPPHISLKLDTPIQVEVVYKEHFRLPEVPGHLHSKTPLLDNAGVTKATHGHPLFEHKENN